MNQESTERQLMKEVPAVQTVFATQAFAKVLGNPVTKLPQDLYIPPDALEVFLESFEGPLDFLLYLIKRQNVNILDIPIAQITEQYMQYVELVSQHRLALAAEYLVMAATLVEIKSRMLLPRPQLLREEDDPRAELMRRLQEYGRYKRAAEDLDQLPRLERDNYLVKSLDVDLKIERPLPSVSLAELLLAFKDVLHRADVPVYHHVEREPLSVRERMSEILDRLRTDEFLKFEALFTAEEGRTGVVVAFMAILELLRESLIDMTQAKPLAPIHVRCVE